MWFTDKNRILGVAALLLLPLLLSGVPRGYADIEGIPGDDEAIPSPELRGKLEAMFDGANKMAATIIGTCRGKQFIIGPAFVTLTTSFAEAMSVENLEGFFLPFPDNPEQLQLPADCFSADEVLQGFVIDTVKKYLLQTPRLVIVKVGVLGVRPKP